MQHSKELNEIQKAILGLSLRKLYLFVAWCDKIVIKTRATAMVLDIS